MIYQHPLAYLLGLEGVALLRAFAGEYDRDFVHRRIEEVRQLVHATEVFGDGVDVAPISITEAYARWAPTYDETNALYEVESSVVRSIIDELPEGKALDAACGTGRHTGYLRERGHDVIGVDRSPDMVLRAAARVPDAGFALGDLHRLPLPERSFDLVVCALALAHVPDLTAALTEFVRVMRPGAHLIISDAGGLAAGIRPPIMIRSAPGYIAHHNRTTGDYLRAALTLGLVVRRLEEPRVADPYVDPDLRPAVEEMLSEDPPNIWWLHHWFPEASNAALRGIPAAVIWHFQLEA